MKDARYKEIMQQLGMPNSQSLLSALRQVANETAQEYKEVTGERVLVVGHVFVWAGDSDYPIPEGYLCNCGMTKAHWKICPTCGNRTLCAVPISHEISYTLIEGGDACGSKRVAIKELHDTLWQQQPYSTGDQPYTACGGTGNTITYTANDLNV